MIKNTDISKFMSKVKSAEAGHEMDLASGEDLSMAVMNLIAIEEHMFFNANKTGKTKYFELLNEAREMRKVLMKMLIPKYEGEVWCTSKHLLAASMRVMEVGTKYQTKGDTKTAYDSLKNLMIYTIYFGL
jgi:thymidine kinase